MQLATAVARPATDEQRPIRLMLVDDSVVARSVLQRILDGQADFEVAALASGVRQALALMQRTFVDIVLLDLEMPGMDGLTGLPSLIEQGRGARVLVLSSACADAGERAVQALALGAADTLQKPSANRFGDSFADLLTDRLRRIGRASGSALPAEFPPMHTMPIAPVVPLRRANSGTLSCIAIGASTGGLPALAALLRALPTSVTAPILVTQHLPATFMPYFAAQIRDIAGRPTKVATTGDRLTEGSILVAPGDAHLGLAQVADSVLVRLDRSAAESGCRPSVDPMLRAVSRVYGSSGIAVILSGMGRDGLLGAQVLAGADGEILAQDAATSVIWGMPGAVAAAGVAAAVLPPAAIAAWIARRAAGAVSWR